MEKNISWGSCGGGDLVRYCIACIVGVWGVCVAGVCQTVLKFSHSILRVHGRCMGACVLCVRAAVQIAPAARP
jgi:hypothetical protein